MAPEQFAGHPPDARTDQFSFGVALYEALYRTLPFRAATGEQRSEAIAAGRFEPPPASAPPVPAWLRRVVLRALAHRPEERFPDMGALLRELSADPGARRRRTMILLSAAASAVAVVGLALWAPGAWREYQARECRAGEAQLATVWDTARQARLRDAFLGTRQPYAEREWGLVKTYLDAFANEWTRMHRVACEDTRVKGTQPPEMMDRRMACLDQQLQNLRATVQQFEKVTPKMLERAAFLALSRSPELKSCEDLRLLSQRPALPESPELRARIQPIIGEVAEARALMLSGDFAQAVEVSRASVTHAQQVGHRPLLAAALYVQGMIDVMRGDHTSSEESLYRAGLVAYAIHDDTITALAWMQLGSTLSGRLNRPAEGARWLEAARAAIDRLGGSPDLEEMLASSQGVAEFLKGNVAQAATHFEQSLALAERMPYANPHRQVNKLINLATCYQTLGRDEEAVKIYRRALATSEAVLGPEHPDTVRALGSLGGLLDRLGSSEESLSMLERAVAASEKRFGSTHVRLISPLSSLAEAYARRGDLGRARASFERALSLILAAHPPQEQDAAVIKGSLAQLSSREGRFREALEQLQAARATLVAHRGEQARDLHEIDAGIAECHLALGRPAEALPLLERVLAAYQQKGAFRLSHSYVQLLLARTLEVLGRDEARVRTLRAEAERLSPGQHLPEALERTLTSTAPPRK
jgi:tetratricopeptide (TPR) repeat protein